MDRIQKRFDELLSKGDSFFHEIKTIDRSFEEDCVWAKQELVQWNTSAESFLESVLGETHPTVKRFNKELADDVLSTSELDVLNEQHNRLLPIFKSAKEQFEGGYLFDVRNLVHAEVFSSELDQAEHFRKNQYDVAAAVTAGVVLETTVKKLCTQQSPPIGLIGSNERCKNADTLISDLKKAEIYNEAVAKQLRAWMSIRNDAAHGTRGNGDFDDGEISRMIEGVRDFVAKHIS